MPRPWRTVTLAAVTLAAVTLAGPSAAAEEPWAALEGVRGSLASDGPRLAEFEHSFVPAGFSQGETERGRLAISLPDCLRWDYTEPYPKVFLVCGNLAHSWNPEDKTGVQQVLDRRQEPGLDLLLLPVAELKTRYRATLEPLAGGQQRIHLVPLQEIQEIKEAWITVDPKVGLMSGVEYLDRDGNRTRFTLSSYRPLADTALFTPPANIEWQASPEP